MIVASCNYRKLHNTTEYRTVLAIFPLIPDQIKSSDMVKWTSRWNLSRWGTNVRQTDHATEKSAAIGGIACAARAIAPPKQKVVLSSSIHACDTRC